MTTTSSDSAFFAPPYLVENEQLKADIAALKNQLSASQAAARESAAQLETLKAECEHQNDRLHKARHQTKALKDKYKEGERQGRKNAFRLRKTQEKLRFITKLRRSTDNQNLALREKVKQQAAEIERLRREVDVLQNETKINRENLVLRNVSWVRPPLIECRFF